MSGVLRHRQRPLVYLVVGSLVVGSCLYLLHSSRSQLQAASQAADKCQQSRDTLSAQLQVAFEQNNRMEATLKQEREVHRKVKEELEKKNAELQQQLDSEKQTLESKYDQLLKDNQLLEAQLNENQDKLRQTEEHFAAKMEELKAQKEDEVEHLNGQLKDFLTEKDQLQKDHDDLKKKNKAAMEDLLVCQKNCPAAQQGGSPASAGDASANKRSAVAKAAPVAEPHHSSKTSTTNITPVEKKLLVPPMLRPMAAPAFHPQESVMVPPPQEDHNKPGQLPPPQDLRRSPQRIGPINSQNERPREAEPDYGNAVGEGDDQEGEHVDENPPRGDHGVKRDFHDDFDDQDNLEDNLRQNGREGVVAVPK